MPSAEVISAREINEHTVPGITAMMQGVRPDEVQKYTGITDELKLDWLRGKSRLQLEGYIFLDTKNLAHVLLGGKEISVISSDGFENVKNIIIPKRGEIFHLYEQSDSPGHYGIVPVAITSYGDIVLTGKDGTFFGQNAVDFLAKHFNIGVLNIYNQLSHLNKY